MANRDEIERTPQPDGVERVRATPVRPVVWMTSVLAWATVVALIGRVPAWASIFLCGVTGASFLLFLVAYIYLFATDREMLRAERYRGRKIAGGAPAIKSLETTELYLGDRGGPATARAGSVNALVGEGRTTPRS